MPNIEINLDDPEILQGIIDDATARFHNGCPGLEEREAMRIMAKGALMHMELAKMRSELSDD